MSCPRVQLRVAGGWLVRYSAYLPCSSPGYVAAAGAGGQAGQAAPSVAPGHRQVRASPPSVLDKFVSCPQLAGVSSPTALVSPSDRIFKHAPLWHFLGQAGNWLKFGKELPQSQHFAMQNVLCLAAERE